MGKQYELLAVEPDLRQRAGAELKRLSGLFTTGSGNFLGQTISYHAILEDAVDVTDEKTELVTTVKTELSQFEKVFGNFMDVSIRKELTNSDAVATVQVGDLTFELSATALLNLESKLEDVRKLYLLIPTLDPTESWEFDKEQDTYVTDTRVAFRTKKVMKAFVAYDATDAHPAQVETFGEDVQTHRRETIISSGAITIADKRKRVGRIDKLIADVKKARQRANDIEASDARLAEEIFAYINQE